MKIFHQNVIYCILPIGDFTTEKQNVVKASINTDIDSLKKNNDETKIIAIFSTSFTSAFVGYEWLTRSEIQEKLLESEWNE